MSVKVDGSHESYVAWCTECDHWAEITNDKMRALVFAARHEQAMHPEQETAEKRLYAYRAKIAKLVG